MNAEPYAQRKMKAMTGGRQREERHLCPRLVCPGAGKVKCFKKKINYNRIDDQSAISSEKHAKYEAVRTYFSVTYQHDRFHLTSKRPQQLSRGPQQQQSMPSTRISPYSIFGGNEHQQMRYADECMPPLFFSLDSVYLLPSLRWLVIYNPGSPRDAAIHNAALWLFLVQES